MLKKPKMPIPRLIILVAAALTLLFSTFLAARFLANEMYVLSSNGETPDPPVFLTALNKPQGDIIDYNAGNAAFSRKDYVEAEKRYRKALGDDMNMKHSHDMLINLALSICYGTGFTSDKIDDMEPVEKITTIARLVEASDVLCQYRCAKPGETIKNANLVLSQFSKAGDDVLPNADIPEQDGHDKDSQQLEDDIEAMLDKLLASLPDDEDTPKANQNDDADETQDRQEKQENQSEEDREKQQRQEKQAEQKEKLLQSRQEAYAEKEETTRQGEFFSNSLQMDTTMYPRQW